MAVLLLYRYFSSHESDGELLSQINARICTLSKSVTESARIDSEACMRLRGILFRGSALDRVDAWRELLAVHADPFFILMLVSGLVSTEIFRIFFFIRFGLAGFTMYHCMKMRVSLSGPMSLVLSSSYALSTVMLTAGQNTGLMNAMILTPLLIAGMEGMISCPAPKSWLKLSVLTASLLSCGSFLYISLPVFAAGMGMVIYCGIRPKQGLRSYFRMMSGILGGYVASGIFLIPGIRFAGDFVDLAEAFREGKVRFDLLDVIAGSIDGRSPVLSTSEFIPPIGLGMTVLLLFVLFVINRRIPYGMKVSALLTLLVLYISCAYSGLDALLGLWGSSGAYLYVRVVFMAAVIVFVAAIAVRNIALISRDEVFFSVFFSILIIMLSNVSVQENRPRAVALGLSLAAVIIAGSLCLIRRQQRHGIFLLTTILAGICLNFALCMGNTVFSPAASLRADIDKGVRREDTEFRTEDEALLPLLTSGDGEIYCLVLTSDITVSAADVSYPEAINLMARAALGSDVFSRYETDNVNCEGMNDFGYDRYAGNGEEHGVITIRGVFDKDSGSRYFVYSGFESRQNVMEICNLTDIFSIFEGPFLSEFTPRESVTALKLSIETPGNITREYGVWMLNDEALSELNSKVTALGGFRFDLEVEPLIGVIGKRSIITSIPYSDRLDVYVRGVPVNTYSVCDKLAFNIEADAMGQLDIEIVNPHTDILAGVAMTVIFIAFAAAVLRGRKVKAAKPCEEHEKMNEITENDDAQQINN